MGGRLAQACRPSPFIRLRPKLSKRASAMNAQSKKRLLPMPLLSTLLLIFSVSAAALGQSRASVDASSPQDSQIAEVKTEVASLLATGEGRDRAWAAYLIGKHELREYLPSLIELLAPTSLTSSKEYLVDRAALDTLIQLQAQVPADVLMPLYDLFTDEVI